MIARRAAERGSTMHLIGIGGDELLYGAPAHLHAMLRRDPRTAMRNLRGFAAKYRWPRRQMMAQLLDNRPYADWLHGIADDLVGPPSMRPDYLRTFFTVPSP